MVGGTPRTEVGAIANLKILISCLHYDWGSAEEAFARCAQELGLDGIEFSLPHPKLDGLAQGTLRGLAGRTGLETSVHVWGDLAQLGVEAGVVQLRGWLATCMEEGFGRLILHGGSHVDRAAGIAGTREALGAVVAEYEKARVTLCLENHYAWEYHDSHELFSTPEEFLAVFEAVASPALGFCLDYGHSQMTGNTRGLLEALGRYLVYTHLADNMGVDDDHLAFGRGVVPWREVLEQTRAAGYTGPFTVEFPVREGTYECLAECVEMIREVYGAA